MSVRWCVAVALLLVIRFMSPASGQDRPDWYRQFHYTAERERGLDDTEDLASPGEFTWSLSGPGEHAMWVLNAGVSAASGNPTSDDVATFVENASAQPNAAAAKRFQRCSTEVLTHMW